MRLAPLLLAFALACSSDPDPDPDPDAGVDAGMSPADGGVVEIPCKDLTCNASETYCKLTPAGPCTIADAGSCPSGEEACVTTGGSGCTPERTPSCEPKDGCSNCACLIGKQPCGNTTVSIQCRSAGGAITLECPYP